MQRVFFIVCFLLLGFISFAQSNAVRGLTPGRAQAIGGGLVALISVVVGWRASRRLKSGVQGGKTQAVIALSLAGIAALFSIIHLSTSAGAVFGSGSGKAGAIIALVLAVVGASISAMALRRRT